MTVDILIFTDCASRTFLRTAGAYTIATILRKNGYTVQVVDYFLLSGLARTLTAIDKFVGENTLFVGFATTFMNLSGVHLDESGKNDKMFTYYGFERTKFVIGTAALSTRVPISDNEMDQIRDRIKLKNLHTKLVMGGTKADFKNQSQIDTFILGYADTTVVEYAKFLQGKNPFFRYTIGSNNQMIVDYDVDASGYDFVHSTIEYHDSDLIRHNEVLSLEVARGCIFKCKFCNFRLIGKKKNDYIKDKEIIYSELMRNYEKFGTTKYSFADDTYNESVQKLEHFAEVFQRLPFKLEFVAYLRHDLIWRYPEMADLLKESGLKVSMFGIETLNHEAGKIIGKGLHPEKTKEMLHWLRNDKGWAGNILMNSGFIVGLPTETRDTVNKWVEELMDFNYPLDSFLVNPLGISPGSPKLSKSEFDLSYKDYGYYFDSEISSGWINDHWKVEDARKLCTAVDKYATELGRIKLYGFNTMTIHNYGYTWDHIHNSVSASYTNSIFYETMKQADRYYEALLK